MRKPDRVAENKMTMPYGDSVSAPAIVKPDVDGFISERGAQAVNAIHAKYEEIQDEFAKLVETSKDNELVYNASIGFVPIVGHVYHLYERDDGSCFLSLIEPHQWDMKCLGSFRLATDSLWIRV